MNVTEQRQGFVAQVRTNQRYRERDTKALSLIGKFRCRGLPHSPHTEFWKCGKFVSVATPWQMDDTSTMSWE